MATLFAPGFRGVGVGWCVHPRQGGYVNSVVGGCGGGETPGYIPNPEAKPSSADGTALVRVWESRTPPDNLPVEGRPIRVGPRLRSAIGGAIRKDVPVSSGPQGGDRPRRYEDRTD